MNRTEYAMKLFYGLFCLSLICGCGSGSSGSSGSSVELPLKVTNVRAYCGSGIAHISWELNTDPGVFAYQVYRDDISTGNGFLPIAVVFQNINHFTDSGLTIGNEFAYSVACLKSDLTAQEQVVSRTVESLPADNSVPKPPGHNASNAPFAIVSIDSSGVAMQWGKPTENTDGTFIAGGTNDLEFGGGFIVYRSDTLLGTFQPIEIIETIDSDVLYTYTDPQGTSSDIYYVRVFDASGNLSAPSYIDVADAAVEIPAMVQDVTAFAGADEGEIVITWSIDASADAGYMVYRSEDADRGFQPVSGIVSPALNTYTDTSAALKLDTTYWYKVSGLASGTVTMEGTLSMADSAVPGPSGEVFYCEAEDATIIQFSASSDWSSLSRQALPAPFHNAGALFIQPSGTAVAGTAFVTLQWSKEIDSAGPGGGVQTYDVYMSVISNADSGTFDLFIMEPVSGTSVISLNGYDFSSVSAGSPAQKKLVYLGQLNFVDEDFVGGNPTNETINCRLGFQGAGELVFDGLMLIRQ